MLSDAYLECNRTISFKAWMAERAAAKEGQSSKTQAPPPGTLMVKEEPWQGPPGFSPDDYLNPAAQYLTGPSNKLQTLPPSKMSKFAEYLVCHLCEASCSSALVMQQHLSGRKHKAKISFKEMKRETTASKPRCDLCEIWCNDVGALQIHFKGQKHMAKVQELQLCKERGGQKSSKAPIICVVCGVSCMNQDLFEQHLKGRKHGFKQDLKRRGLL